MTESKDPTEGRVYGGASNLIHIPDGERQSMGVAMAAQLSLRMRTRAFTSGARTLGQAFGDDGKANEQPLCPGCYMVAIVAMAVELAQKNGQSITELGNSLSRAFDQLAKGGVAERNMEWIDVQLDPPQPTDADIELAWTRATFGGFPL